MAFAEDLSVFFDLAGFAVSATWNGSTVNVIYDAPAVDVLSGEAIGTDFSVTLKSTDWPAIARGATVVVSGKGTYTVREVRPLHDGALTRLMLAV